MTNEQAPAGAESHPHGVPWRVLQGTAFMILGRVWSAGCTLLMLKIGADNLRDVAAFGRFTFYLALFSWLDSIVNLGTAEVAVQRTANDPHAMHGVLVAARRIRFRMGALAAMVVSASAFAFGEPGAAWVALATLYPLTHALEVETTVFKNRIAWGVPVVVRSLASGLSLGFVWFLARNGYDQPALYLVGVAAGSAIGNVLFHVTARRHLPAPSGPIVPAHGIFAASWPLGLSSVCAMSYYYVDNVYIRALRSEAELGPYNVAVRVMSLLIMVAQYSSLSALPWLARRHAAGELHRALWRLAPPLFALAGLGAGLLLPWTEPLLDLFQPGFGAAAGDSMRWLLGGMASIYAGSILLCAVIATGNNKAKLRIQSFGLAFNLVANCWAVPALGITGAGMTTCMTEALVAVGAAIALVKSGVPLFTRSRWLLWLGGPVMLGLGAWLSSLLPLS